jgi:hypothetical protein
VRRIFSFPDPVNEVAARVVAGCVVLLCIATLITVSPVLMVVLAAGFLARLLTGPTLSPLGQFATRVAAPRIGHANPVPGPPKRFAQGMGAFMSVAAVVAWFGFGAHAVALVLIGLIALAATLESVFAFCLGCKAFALLMRVGVIPESACEACNDLSLRRTAVAARN